MNTISVFIGTDEFVCREFYDSDTSIGGVDVSDETGKHIGEIWGLFIPMDEDENSIDYTLFNSSVEEFLKEKYY